MEYYKSSTGQIENLKISGDMLMGQKAEQLVKFGVDIHLQNKKNVLAAITTSRKKANNSTVFDTYGWTHLKEGPAFLHANAITRSGKLDRYRQSDLVGLDLTPGGDYNKWLAMYEATVRGNIPLELAVVLGASAPILAHLDSNYPDLKTLIVHLNGQSSQGKTTAAALAVSVGANPTSKGLLKSWNSTEIGIMGYLDNNNGITICFDELSQSSSENITTLLYSLAEGRQKNRADKTGTLRKPKYWCTTILSTGELSMFNRLDQNLGLRVRIIELSQVQWTESASQSEAIKQCINNNYGHLLPLFVEKLLVVGLEQIDRDFEKQREILLGLMPESTTTERVSMKLAVLMTTAHLLNRLNIVTMDVEAVRRFLVEHDKASFNDRDMATVALDQVCQYLVAQQSKLIRIESGRTPNEVIGELVVKTKSGTKTMYASILKQQFEAIMDELGFQDKNVVLKDWLTKGILLVEKGRLSYRKPMQLDGKKLSKIPTYTFEIPAEYQPLFVQPVTFTPGFITSDDAVRDLGINPETVGEEDFEF